MTDRLRESASWCERSCRLTSHCFILVLACLPTQRPHQQLSLVDHLLLAAACFQTVTPQPEFLHCSFFSFDQHNTPFPSCGTQAFYKALALHTCFTGKKLVEMADPLSFIASLIAVAQISGEIVSLCYNYRTVLKGANKNTKQLADEVKSPRDVLENLIRDRR